jgi:hypothetical protein
MKSMDLDVKVVAGIWFLLKTRDQNRNCVELRGFLEKVARFSRTLNCFHMENSVDLVHTPWTTIEHGPWWTDHHGRPPSSPELGSWPLRAPWD